MSSPPVRMFDGAPDGEPDGRRVAAVVLEMAGEQAPRRSCGRASRRWASAPRGCRANRNCARWAGRRADRGVGAPEGPAGDEAAVEAGEQGGDLAAAAGPEAGRMPALDRSHDGRAGGARRGGAAGDKWRRPAPPGARRCRRRCAMESASMRSRSGGAEARSRVGQLGRRAGRSARSRSCGEGADAARRRRPSPAARQTCERHQEIGLETALGARAQNVQAVADLALLEVAEQGIELRASADVVGMTPQMAASRSMPLDSDKLERCRRRSSVVAPRVDAALQGSIRRSGLRAGAGARRFRRG